MWLRATPSSLATRVTLNETLTNARSSSLVVDDPPFPPLPPPAVPRPLTRRSFDGRGAVRSSLVVDDKLFPPPPPPAVPGPLIRRSFVGRGAVCLGVLFLARVGCAPLVAVRRLFAPPVAVRRLFAPPVVFFCRPFACWPTWSKIKVAPSGCCWWRRKMKPNGALDYYL